MNFYRSNECDTQNPHNLSSLLLEMRTDGEITKQEFLDQRKKLDKELQELQAEYDSKAHNPIIERD